MKKDFKKPERNWNIEDCREFAVYWIEKIMAPDNKKKRDHYVSFKNFKQRKSMKAGIRMGTCVSIYLLMCGMSDVNKKIQERALDEITAEYLPRLEKWYNKQLQ